MPVRRPWGVSLLVALVIIAGILQIISGVITLVVYNEPGVVIVNTSGATVPALAIAVIVFGVIYLLVARGLANGNNVARLIVAVLSVLNIASGIWAVIVHTGALESGGWSSIVFGVIILVLLYSPKANAFFAPRDQVLR